MNSTSKTHIPSIGILLLSGGGAFLAFTSTAGFFLAGILNCLPISQNFSQAQSLFNLAWAAGLIFLLLLPSTSLAAIRLLGKPVPEIHIRWIGRAVNIAVLAVPLLIGLGYLVSGHSILAMVLLPVFQIAIVTLTLLWMLETGRKNLLPGSSQREWGLLSFSITATMPLAILFELLLIAGIVFTVLIYLSVTSPLMLDQLSTMANRLMSSDMDREAILRVLRPFFNNPLLIYAFIAVTAGIIPLLEEFLKPLALWCLSAKHLSPREGFVGGMICGVAFALLESLGALVDLDSSAWVFLIIGRIGTGLLHITTSGLVGWGLARAWSEGKYLSLVGAYLAAFGFHSLWNTTALMTGFRELAQFSPLMIERFDSFIEASPFILVMLAGFMVLMTIKANRILRSGPGSR
ncbi:MAG: PrsW family intramembrane metalloprotease [Leptolinea sp.]|jgi:hypothetical protein|nr:PrsW family intramembrane metalloprotease [Leptolinea sp.]